MDLDIALESQSTPIIQERLLLKQNGHYSDGMEKQSLSIKRNNFLEYWSKKINDTTLHKYIDDWPSIVRSAWTTYTSVGYEIIVSKNENNATESLVETYSKVLAFVLISWQAYCKYRQETEHIKKEITSTFHKKITYLEIDVDDTDLSDIQKSILKRKDLFEYIVQENGIFGYLKQEDAELNS